MSLIISGKEKNEYHLPRKVAQGAPEDRSGAGSLVF